MLLLFSIGVAECQQFGKELPIRITMRVFLNVYEFVCVLPSLLFRGWDMGFDCINS